MEWRAVPGFFSASGAGGGLIGPKPPSPFSSTYVGVNNQGQLDLGRSISQLTDTAADRTAAQAAITQTNSALTTLGVKITGIEVDLAEMSEQAKDMEQRLGELLAQMEQAIGQQMPTGDEEAVTQEPAE